MARSDQRKRFRRAAPVLRKAVHIAGTANRRGDSLFSCIWLSKNRQRWFSTHGSDVILPLLFLFLVFAYLCDQVVPFRVIVKGVQVRVIKSVINIVKPRFAFY